MGFRKEKQEKKKVNLKGRESERWGVRKGSLIFLLIMDWLVVIVAWRWRWRWRSGKGGGVFLEGFFLFFLVGRVWGSYVVQVHLPSLTATDEYGGREKEEEKEGCGGFFPSERNKREKFAIQGWAFSFFFFFSFFRNGPVPWETT